MLPPEILQRKSLFAFLHKIEVDLADSHRAKRCPAAGAHCIALFISASLGVGPRISTRRIRFVSAFVVDGQAAVADPFRRRCSSWGAVFTGGWWFL
jgi:hypothetical protein